MPSIRRSLQRAQDGGAQRWRAWRRRRAVRGKAGGVSRLTLALVAMLAVALGTFAACLAFLYGGQPSARDLPLSALTAQVKQGHVERMTLLAEDNTVLSRLAGSDTQYRTQIATDGAFTDLVATSPTTVAATGVHLRADVDPQQSKRIVSAVTTFLLPLVILANLFALFMALGKSGGSGIGEVMTFGKVGAGKDRRAKSPVSFEQVGGAGEAVVELREVVDYLTDPARYRTLGAAPPKGVLLFGPPGTGKTLLAKAVAGEAGVPFFSVAGAEFVESLVGVGAARVRDLFARVRAAAPAIVFIDELDAAGRKRGAGSAGGGTDEREQTLNQLLVEMDGFDVSEGVVVMGATNRPDILDPALMRPGRFDRHITIDRPDAGGREQILRIHAAGKPLAPDADLQVLARRTPGFTGADLANVVNESILLAIREARSQVTMDDLTEAVHRVLHGPKRRGRLLSADEKRRAAVHEAGHAVAMAAAGRLEHVERVSLLTGGAMLARTELDPEAAPSSSKSALETTLSVFMAGRAAEQLLYADPSTGAERDLQQATDLARQLVARYGLSDAIGPVRLLADSSEGFLDTNVPYAEIAEATREVVDVEIKRLLQGALDLARRTLMANRTVFDQFCDALEAQETLDGARVRELLADVRPAPLRPVGSGNARSAVSQATSR
jgi:cell division protease FtsH